MKPALKRFLDVLSSLQLTILCLSLLMALIVFCTLDQVHLGTFGAVDKYFRHFFLYGPADGFARRLPVFPGGGMVGAILLFNLSASHFYRFQWTRRKSGIWLIHAGLIVLVLGEFVTGMLAVESQMAVEEGFSRNYTESPRLTELTVVDASSKEHDEVYSIPESILSRQKVIRHPKLPFTILVKKYYENSTLADNPGWVRELPSLATMGVGKKIIVRPAAPVSRDDEANQVSAFVELMDGDRSLGTWLASTAVDAPQGFSYLGVPYRLALRHKRYYLPFTIFLKDFKHDLYPGTEIPKNFSSSVLLSNEKKGENREALIYMNHPLYYEGKTFYQASFAKNDTVSIFQVVENPGWVLPYIAFILVGVGLLTQFLTHLLAFKAESSP
ncbi:MAG: cytochrome c biogenesis protein ResB [Elusimicrobia bacterium]|nr:cytochrome c biogenesis protein ResB [Elusimicrobiota bacterium]